MQEVVQSVPFLDLTRQYQQLEKEWFSAIRKAGSSGAFILGENVTALERELAAFIGAGHAVGVASGTDALILALRAAGIGPGCEVITSPFTFFATAEAITLVGATPVFADIEPGSFNLDPAGISGRVTKNTRAIIPVHLYGRPADMTAIMSIAGKHDLTVIEDCAQSFGADIGGRRVGGIGHAGCFSFYPTKVLGCYGDGGMITVRDAQSSEHLRRLRNHGAVKPFIHNEVGYNSRLDEIQAALLRIKLKIIDRDIDGRRRVAAAYDERLSGLDVTLPALDTGHVFNLYTIRLKKRDHVRNVLMQHDIASAVCYPLPLHLQEVYKSLGYQAGDLPHCEQAAREVLSLPVYPGMEEAHIERVCDVLHAALEAS